MMNDSDYDYDEDNDDDEEDMAEGGGGGSFYSKLGIKWRTYLSNEWGMQQGRP